MANLGSGVKQRYIPFLQGVIHPKIQEALETLFKLVYSLQDSLSQGTGPEYIKTLTPPDGSRTAFLFAQFPKQVVYNGLVKFQGDGFVVVDANTVQILDWAGSVITPVPEDLIYAQVK